MFDIKTNILRTGLNLLHATRLYRVFAPYWTGRGLVFMLHHIRPAVNTPDLLKIHPNGILEITPEFLSQVIRKTRLAGVDIISLESAVERLGQTDSRPFAVFTIDDGYLDNIEHALPIFEKEQCPFTVFITPKIIEGTCELWWQALEYIINGYDEISYRLENKECSHKTATLSGKKRAYQTIYWSMRAMDQKHQRVFIRKLAGKYQLDLDDLCARQAMSWHQVRDLQEHPLATIGAHSVNHYALARLSEAEVLSELVESRAWIAEETGKEPDFFCYPYGDPGSAGPREFEMTKRAGYKAAVTTRKGLLFDGHKEHLSALPRVSLNGDYQALKYIELYLSGAPFAIWNRFRKLNVD